MSFLNVFIRNLNNGVRHPYDSQWEDGRGRFPIKNFGNDEREVDASLNFRHEG